MNTRILDIIRNPEILNVEDLKLLESEIDRQPYMQSLRAIYLLGTHKYNHQDFQGELTKTAAYTTDKKILYKFINQNKPEEKNHSLATTTLSQQEEAKQPSMANKEKAISPTGIDYYTKSIATNKEEEKNIPTPKITFEKTIYEPKTHIMDFYSSPIGSKAKENSPINFYEKPISLSDREETFNILEDTTNDDIELPHIIQETTSEEDYQWVPMQEDTYQNIQNDDIPESEPSTTEENTIQNEPIQKQDIDKKGSSNVSSFINTWQNWLKIDRTTQVSQQDKTAAIIDKFIESNPKISPIKENVDFVVKEKSDDISHLMTETLAQLYVEQKLYTKAINAFRILQEKYPEKTDIFERKIEEIKQRK